MKKAIALTLAASMLLLAGCCTAHQTAHWEYKTQRVYMGGDLNPGTLNANARDGWEFVSATVVPNDPSGSAIAVFKRRIK